MDLRSEAGRWSDWRRVLIVALVVAGCASAPVRELPETANRPRPAKLEQLGTPSLPDTSRMITYRTLLREDFWGQRPHKDFVHQTLFLGAVTCIFLRTGGKMRFAVRRVAEVGGGAAYEVRIEPAVFKAEVDRACSWWNAANGSLSPPRVLEHEQIHFALFEIVARRLNQRLLGLSQNWSYRADSPGRAREAARRAVDRLLREATQELDQRHIQFDQETGGGSSWERQQLWRQRVEAELEETEPYQVENLQAPGP